MSPTPNTGNIQVVLEGRGPVTLRPNDHVATGGEGSIYRVSDLAVKVYLDPRKMRDRGVPERVKKFSSIFTHPFIVAPLGLAVNAKGEAVGHYLPYVPDPPDAHPLSRVFTNDFRRAEGFKDKQAMKLVDRMRETVMFAHDRGAILIDPNELNWFALAVKKDPEPRIIDVDSWVVGPMPATVAVMPSIRDWHAKKFGSESDWFAWAVVTFQVFTGIHPYKGSLDGYSVRDMEKRMKDNASVFTKGVRLNAAVRDFTCIPGPLLGWYEAIFQKGERSKPPSPFDTGIAVPQVAQVLRATTTTATGLLIFEKLYGIPGDSVGRVYHCGVVRMTSGALIDLRTKRQILASSSSTCEVVKAGQGWLIVDIVDKTTVSTYVRESDLNPTPLNYTIRGSRIVRYENRLFVVGENGLTELKSTQFGDRLVISGGQTWGIISNSTKWFDGVGVLDSMGAKFIIAPFGDGAVAQARVKELDGVRVVTAKSGNRFVSLVGIQKNGDYQKIELYFDREYRTYKAWVGTVDGPELNLAILPKGVCATIVRDGELSIFVPANGSLTKVEDSKIRTDMLLANWEDKVVYTQNDESWLVRMK